MSVRACVCVCVGGGRALACEGGWAVHMTLCAILKVF